MLQAEDLQIGMESVKSSRVRVRDISSAQVLKDERDEAQFLENFLVVSGWYSEGAWICWYARMKDLSRKVNNSKSGN